MALRHNGPKGPILWRSIPNPEASYGARYGANRSLADVIAQVVEDTRRAMKRQQP
jgi:hypothetical protein